MVGNGLGSGSTITIDLNLNLNRVENGTPTTTLGHELFHSKDMVNGELNPNNMTLPNGNTVKTNEYRAVQFENVIRANSGVPLRDTYDGVKGMLIEGHDYKNGLPDLPK